MSIQKYSKSITFKKYYIQKYSKSVLYAHCPRSQKAFFLQEFVFICLFLFLTLFHEFASYLVMSICYLDFGGLHVYLQQSSRLLSTFKLFTNSFYKQSVSNNLYHLYTTVTLTWDIFQLGFRSIQESHGIIYLLGFIYFKNQIFTGRNPRLED